MLTHYDIPDADPDSWSVGIVGLVDRPLDLSLADLDAMTQHTVRVTLECAGNGRAADHPRPVSQPWLDGAVGTADWTGVRLADLLADAGLQDGAVSVVFAGADHGVERGVEQDYERGLSVADATGGGRAGRDLDERRARCRRSTGTRSGSSSPAGTAWPR